MIETRTAKQIIQDEIAKDLKDVYKTTNCNIKEILYSRIDRNRAKIEGFDLGLESLKKEITKQINHCKKGLTYPISSYLRAQLNAQITILEYLLGLYNSHDEKGYEKND